jgi:triacylglycerol lipase
MMTSALLAAAGTMFATCQMPEGDIKQPETWGQYFLDKYAAERAEAMDLSEPAPAPLAQPRTVLLITGVTIPAEWFDPIKARLERDGFRPVVYEPPDLLSGDLFWNSEQLGHVIDGIRAQTGEERIDILAECTGGLLARHYVQALGGDQHVRRIVTFISPQHGLPKAAEASLFVDWDAVNDLTPGSEFLDTVNSAPMSSVPITSIYTCTDEYIQPYDTAIIPGAKNIGLGCDGTFVGHYQFFYDREIYKLMHSELVAPAPTDVDAPAPTDPAEPEPTEPVAEELGGCSSTHGSSAGLVLLAAIALLARRRRTA